MCGADSGEVTVTDLITMVNIALGNALLSTRPVGDADGSAEITVEEIIQAVNDALNGCPQNSGQLSALSCQLEDRTAQRC